MNLDILTSPTEYFSVENSTGNTKMLSVRPSVPSSVRPSLRPSVLPSVYPSVHLSLCPSIRPSVRPSVPRPSVRPFIHPSTHPYIHPSIHPSIHPLRLPTEISKTDFKVKNNVSNHKIRTAAYRKIVNNYSIDHMARKANVIKQPEGTCKLSDGTLINHYIFQYIAIFVTLYIHIISVKLPSYHHVLYEARIYQQRHLYLLGFRLTLLA